MASIPEQLPIPPIKPRRFADLLLPPGVKPTIPYLPADQATRPLGPVIAPMGNPVPDPAYKRDDALQGKPGPVPAGPVRPRVLRLGSTSLGGTRITDEERDLMIRTVIGEAAGEDDTGQSAVAHVVMNRYKSGRYGRDIKGVLFAKKQFEPWSTRKGELMAVPTTAKEYQRAALLVDAAIAGGEDPTKGATHFLNPEIVRKRRKKGDLPSWATDPLVAIGLHEFYAPALKPGQHGVIASGEGVRDLAGTAGSDLLRSAPDAGQSYLLHRTQAGADDLIAKEEARQKARQMLKGGVDKALEPQIPAGPSALPEAVTVPPKPAAVDSGMSASWGDVWAAVVDAPMQAVGGVFDAARNVAKAGDSLADWLETVAPTAQILGGEGADGTKGGPNEWLAEGIDTVNPAGEPQTEAGRIARTFTTFVAGFGRAMGPGTRLAEKIGLSGKVAKSAASVPSGAVTGGVVMDPFEPGIANLVQEFPALANPVTEFLTVSPDDTEGEARLKHALEEAGFGALTEGLLIGLRAARDWKAARGGPKPTDAAAQAAAYGTVKPADFAILGDPTKPILSVGPKVPRETSGAKLKAGEAATAGKGTDVPLGGGPIVASATRVNGEVFTGQLHSDAMEKAVAAGKLPASVLDGPTKEMAGVEQGFVTRDGRFVDRKEAMRLTVEADKMSEAASMYRGGSLGGEDLPVGSAAGAPADEIFINFSRIDTADDVKGVIRRMATTFSGQIDEGRRGVQSFEDTKALADELGMTVPDLLSRRQGQPFNAEEALAARRLWAASAEKLLETAKAAAAPNAGPVDQFNFRRMMAIHYAVQAEVIGARTETARALSAWRIPAGGGTEQARAIQQTMDSMGGAVSSAEMAKRLTMLSEAGVDSSAINTFARKGWAATSVDAIREYWINALLSSPTTHIVNMTSNTLVAFQAIMERKAGEGVAALRGSGDGVAPGEAMAMAFGMVGSVKDGLRAAWKTARTGENIDFMGKVDTGPTPAISSDAFRIASDTGLGRAVDFIGATIRVPGAAMGVEDAFFKTVGYRMNLRAEALRMAYGEGKRGSELAARVGEILKDAPEHLKISAADAALYQTFTNETGKFGKGLLALRSSAPVVGFVLPFIKTPLNIARYAFERTPLAPLVGQWRADIAAGGARRDLAIAKMATGSTVMLATMDYADRGLISGAGPDDPGEREALMRQGWQQYSVKVGDSWYSYNRLDPMGMTLGFAADMAETIKRGEIEAEEVDTVNEVLAASIAAVSNTVVNKTYMQGIAEFVDMMEDPDRYASGYIDNFLGSFVPAGAAAAERIIDPTTRERMAIGDAVYDRIAGLSDSLPPKRDLWGKILRPDSGMGPTFDALSPVRVAKIVDSPIDAEMTRLNTNQLRIKKALNWDGVNVNLRDWPDVFDAYVRLAGNELKNPGYDDLGAKDFLDRVVSGKHDLSEIYMMGSEGGDGGKALFISKTIQEYRQLARDAIMADPQFADFAAWVSDQKAAQDRRELEVIGAQ